MAKKNKQVEKIKKRLSLGGLIAITLCFAIGLVAGYFTYGFLTQDDKFFINGEQNVYIVKGAEYKEEYATAVHFGKDCSKDVKIEGEINVDVPGRYVLKYTINKFRFKNTVRYRYVTVTEASDE